ncbi:MAG: protein Tex, partial [Bradyrhizobium sp.]|nr:protein Tex [Bradyrhizobium sp.]
MANIHRQIAEELGVREQQVEATVALLDGGATVPFIARYRKEITGALDDAQLRTLEERLNYLRELEERRIAILDSVREQGKLDAALEAAILAADSKGRLEDIYLPFKPKRRTKAEIAKEAGLEPLADLLLKEPENDPRAAAAPFINADKQIADAAAALEGARAILVERFAEDADLIGALREQMWSSGQMASTVRKGKKTEGEKFKDYFDFSEPLTKLPSHRILAMFRGEKEEILDLQMLPEPASATPAAVGSYELQIMQRFAISDQGRPGDKWLTETARWAWRTKIQVHLNIDLRMRLWTAAEQEAVRVFALNLRDLLLAPPAGARVTMGLDPGFRSGVKVAVVDTTGKVVATSTIYPHEPARRRDEALATLGKLAVQHRVDLIAIGNGTASRETDKLAMDLVKLLPELKMSKVVVSEAGASVYSASAFASEELPELDVTLRGAVSIARRLQDPLAELVKIDPKAIGVGQYQHDLGESKLARSLDAVVEDCVNAVGVDANTASAPLLARVSG